MKARLGQSARLGLFLFTAIWMLLVVPLAAAAAPYAAMVMDARSGEVLHSRNADTRLHPASLTKMMTLYVVFEAVENGEIGLDDKVRISSNAAAEPPSKLGLKSGQRIALRYLIRAAAVKSANDAATALGEAISGSEAAFARRMNRTAKALGMTRTTFKNAHGLTEKGHMSTARDMTILGRHVLFDYPQYYNLFSRKSANAGVREVANTNRRLLANYKGADGIKTGYTRAAGFNLVASAERGNERIIATVFGGRSTATRNAKVAELLDLGFKRAPTRVATRLPGKPKYQGGGKSDRVLVSNGSVPGGKGKTIRIVTAVKKSLRPRSRPGAAPAEVLMAGLQDEIENAVAQAAASPLAAVMPNAPKVPEMEAASVVQASTTTATTATTASNPSPRARPANLVLASVEQQLVDEPREVVTRLSSSGGRHWGINVGRYGSRYQAERVLLKTALAEMTTLDGSLRKVVKNPRGFDANFVGMSRETADLACRRLQARNVQCFMIGPG